jgi:hypothetical protein
VPRRAGRITFGAARAGLPVGIVVGIVFVLGGAACGPEMFHQGAEGLGGAAGGGVGAGGAAGLPDDANGGTGGVGGDDGGASCVNGNGGVSGDASVPAFTSSWTFDGPGSLLGWAPIGQPSDVVAATTLALDDQDGFPCAGSARLTIPFSTGSSQVDLGYSFPNGPQNLSGKVLTARVRLNSANASGTIMVGLAYKSVAGVYLFASSAVPVIVAGNGWITLSLSFDHPDGFVDMSRSYADGAIITPDPTAVLEIDVLVLTGNAPFTTTDVSVDTVGISDP